MPCLNDVHLIPAIPQPRPAIHQRKSEESLDKNPIRTMMTSIKTVSQMHWPLFGQNRLLINDSSRIFIQCWKYQCGFVLWISSLMRSGHAVNVCCCECIFKTTKYLYCSLSACSVYGIGAYEITLHLPRPLLASPNLSVSHSPWLVSSSMIYRFSFLVIVPPTHLLRPDAKWCVLSWSIIENWFLMPPILIARNSLENATIPDSNRVNQRFRSWFHVIQLFTQSERPLTSDKCERNWSACRQKSHGQRLNNSSNMQIIINGGSLMNSWWSICEEISITSYLIIPLVFYRSRRFVSYYPVKRYSSH